MQRQVALKNHCIMDGRDIGTVVLPNASHKFFLTASAEVRAERRHKELALKGQNVDYESLLKEINLRDYNDSHRKIAPLKKADDAYLIDSSNLSVDQVVDFIVSIIEQG